METKDTSAGTNATIAAQYPLGSLFYLQIVKSDLAAVPSRFQLTAPAISPPLEKPALFAQEAVLPFDINSPGPTKYFRAVHLGTATLTITPVDTSLPPITVSLTVTRPTSLGNSIPEFDSDLINIGHKTGIPPTLIKGQAHREAFKDGRFDRSAYRYEPFTVDCQWTSRGKNTRTQAVFRDYRLATVQDGTNGPLTQGSKVIQDDISPRTLYSILDPVTRRRRPITNNDQFVSAREIFDVNDGGRATSGQRWFVEKPEIHPCKQNLDLLNFTAQTTLAGSYGLFQVLHDTAVTTLKWAGLDGNSDRKNPSYLFDTTDNLNRGGGTIGLAQELVRKFYPSGTPASQSEFRQGFIKSYVDGYNGRASYGTEVFGFAANYGPVQNGSIFQ